MKHVQSQQLKHENDRRRFAVSILNFEHTSHNFVDFLLLNLNKQMLVGVMNERRIKKPSEIFNNPCHSVINQIS